MIGGRGGDFRISLMRKKKKKKKKKKKSGVLQLSRGGENTTHLLRQ